MTATPQQPRGTLPLGILMGAIVGALVLVIVWFGAGLGDSRTGTPAPSPSPSSPTANHTGPSSTPTKTTTPSASPTPEEVASAEPIEGIVTELPVGSWVTVLKSLPQSGTTPAQALAQASELSRPGHQAVVLDTNAFRNLNRGYFAIVIPGATTRAEVAATCAAIGIPLGDHCYPREIKG